ncbi:MAG: diguanylate cyclase [Oscillospiraceae bacterium]|nr:diguanylate cyclase [Oscillospiraceae bacterium]
MKNKLIKRMYIILVITTLLASGGVYTIIYFTSQNSIMVESVERAMGIKEYILNSLGSSDFVDIGEDTQAGRDASLHIQGILNDLRGIAGLRRLYIATINDAGDIITTDTAGVNGNAYVPSGDVEIDLRRSINEGLAIVGDRFYKTGEGSVFTIFWPVTDQNHQLLGTVCMEFDVDYLSQTNTLSLSYGLAMSAGLLIIISLVSYLSMNRASEPYFKKLAYTDFLTGYENRMAFEQKLRECGKIADSGEFVTLIICDVNNLKIINDTQGHKAGDLYIQNTADIIASKTKKVGSLYRIGGDEFAVIIVGRSESEIDALMTELREERSMAIKNQPFSCACGAATFTIGIDKSLRDVFKRADDAMYIDKKKQKGII